MFNYVAMANYLLLEMIRINKPLMLMMRGKPNPVILGVYPNTG